MFEEWNRRPSIGVIGDGALPEDSDKRDIGRELGEALVDAGYRVVCGGLGGIMEAVCRGAHASAAYEEGRTVGILPGTRPGSANDYVDIAVATGLGDARNALVGRSDAVVALGGGAGTLSEMAYAWIARRLVAAFEVEGWSGRLAGDPLDHRDRFDGIEDDRVYAVQTPDEVVALLEDRLATYRRLR